MNQETQTHAEEDHSYLFEKKRALNILIVDDNLESIDPLRLLLLDQGHTVTVVEEGPRCITLCQNNRYDLIFMDYHMEGLDGDTVVEIIKDDPMDTTVIMAFTADKTPECTKKFAKIGVTGIIYKPTDLELLLLLIRNMEIRRTLDEVIVKKLQTESEGGIIFFL